MSVKYRQILVENIRKNCFHVITIVLKSNLCCYHRLQVFYNHFSLLYLGEPIYLTEHSLGVTLINCTTERSENTLFSFLIFSAFCLFAFFFIIFINYIISRNSHKTFRLKMKYIYYCLGLILIFKQDLWHFASILTKKTQNYPMQLSNCCCELENSEIPDFNWNSNSIWIILSMSSSGLTSGIGSVRRCMK